MIVCPQAMLLLCLFSLGSAMPLLYMPMPSIDDSSYCLCMYRCHSRFPEGSSRVHLPNPASMIEVGDEEISNQRGMQNNNTCAPQDLFGALPLRNRQVRFTNILHNSCISHRPHEVSWKNVWLNSDRLYRGVLFARPIHLVQL
jgi:hypothetical protein